MDGAQALSDRGASKIVTAGADTAQKFGEMYAVLEAGAERATTDDMIVGAPQGSVGLAAYSFEIQGEDGEGQHNQVRALTFLALLAAAVGVATVRRRQARSED